MSRTAQPSYNALHKALAALERPLRQKIRNQTVSKLAYANATQDPDKIALYCFPEYDYQATPTGISWSQWHAQAMAMAAFFLSKKITKRTVLIMCRNRLEHFVADLASLYASNTPCSIYTTLAQEQIETILQITHSPIIIVDSASMYDQVKQAVDLTHHCVEIICIERPSHLHQPSLLWSKCMEVGHQILPKYRKTIDTLIQKSASQDPACMIFTSGTTGQPKGVVLSHENVLFAASGVDVVGTSHIPQIRMLSYLPLAHVFERIVGYYACVYRQNTLYCVWQVQDLKAALLAVRPHVFVGVPRVYEKIEQSIIDKLSAVKMMSLVKFFINLHKKIDSYRLKQQSVPLRLRFLFALFDHTLGRSLRRAVGLDACRVCLSGSAPLDAEVIHFFASLNLTVVEGYGLTENSAPAVVSWTADLANNLSRFFSDSKIAVPVASPCQFGRVGYPMPGTRIKIDTHGQVLVFGPHVFHGYFNNAKSTQAALQDGWLKTGDLGVLHDSGELEIVGRKKDILVLSNGKNIAPRHIEAALGRHPLIAQTCLLGDGRAYLIAVICLRSDGYEQQYAKKYGLPAHRNRMVKSPRTHGIIQAHIDKVNANFSRPEQIKYFYLTDAIWSPESGELTPTLKLKRAFVMSKYQNIADRIYLEHDPNGHSHP